MKNEESKIQQACVTWFDLQYQRYSTLFFAVPNGGKRNVITATIMKKEGVRRGVADLILLLPRNGYHGLLIEMKTKKGRQSEFQKAFQAATECQGYKYAVCRSEDEFKQVVNEYIKN